MRLCSTAGLLTVTVPRHRVALSRRLRGATALKARVGLFPGPVGSAPEHFAEPTAEFIRSCVVRTQITCSAHTQPRAAGGTPRAARHLIPARFKRPYVALPTPEPRINYVATPTSMYAHQWALEWLHYAPFRDRKFARASLTRAPPPTPHLYGM